MNLNQVTVCCFDLDKSIEFYLKIGLKLIVHSTDHYARFLCPNGNSTFSAEKVNKDIEIGKTKIYFETEELDKKVEILKTKGLQFDQMPTDMPWLWREAHLKDPFGNLIILYHAGENRINPPWRLLEF